MRWTGGQRQSSLRGVSSEGPTFAAQSLPEIIEFLRERLDDGADIVELEVSHPDLGAGLFPGEVTTGGRHRPWRVWVDLADRLQLRLGAPERVSSDTVRLRFERLDREKDWRGEPDDGDVTERYGAESGYWRLSKLEDPSFVLDMADALERIGPGPDARVLALGVNRGDELELLCHCCPGLERTGSFVGVDHSGSAIAQARARFGGANFRFVQADINALEDLELGEYDLVLSIGTLQSPGIDRAQVLRHVMRHTLSPAGAVIFGFPNCRYVDGEVVRGARTKNFSQPELGLLIRDLAFFRKYLHQHHRQVYVTGDRYILVTGVRRP